MTSDIFVATRSTPIKPLLTANDTTAGTSVANPADTLVEPTGSGVIDLGHYGVMAANELLLIPFGVGAEDATFLLSIFALDVIPGSQGNPPDQWTYWLLGSWTCTLCTLTGVANGTVGTTNRYCDTIVKSAGNEGVTMDTVSPTGNVKASIMLDGKGGRKVVPKFAMNGSATSANLLWRLM